MQSFQQHEQFEMEVLKLISDHRLLNGLVFGGGTCLRLCYGLKRFSVDLDFWIKPTSASFDFAKMKRALRGAYELSDAKAKHFTYLIELKSSKYPHRLKIEIHKSGPALFHTEQSIAFSFFSTLQVQLNTFTLNQMWRNKVAAFLTRKEIRDAYDLEFIYKKGGADLDSVSSVQKRNLLHLLDSFTLNDFNVKLGSLVEPDERAYYSKEGFKVLKNALR